MTASSERNKLTDLDSQQNKWKSNKILGMFNMALNRLTHSSPFECSQLNYQYNEKIFFSVYGFPTTIHHSYFGKWDISGILR